MPSQTVVCREVLDATDVMTAAAGKLYEATLDADERIPWAWIERSLGQPSKGRSSGWVKHLLIATVGHASSSLRHVQGYGYGAFIPGFGGYLCYLGVDPAARRLGVGSALYRTFFRHMAEDAARAGEPLPFVVWESKRPTEPTSAADHDLWTARTRLFDRVGGLWVEGVEMLTPNYGDDDAPPVPLQVFVKPVEEQASAFDAERLTGVVGGLLERVYGTKPGDPLYTASLPSGCRPRLVPARVAGGEVLGVK